MICYDNVMISMLLYILYNCYAMISMLIFLQLFQIPLLDQTFNVRFPHIELRVFYQVEGAVLCLDPVSYTHLDVYKRQIFATSDGLASFE